MSAAVTPTLVALNDELDQMRSRCDLAESEVAARDERIAELEEEVEQAHAANCLVRDGLAMVTRERDQARAELEELSVALFEATERLEVVQPVVMRIATQAFARAELEGRAP